MTASIVPDIEPTTERPTVGGVPAGPDARSPAGTGVRATWLGHSALVLDLGGARLLTDPLLRTRLGALRHRADLPVHRHVDDVDAVLLSHLHHDHADLPSLRRLGHAPVLTHPANLPWLERQRLGVLEATPEEWVRVAPGVEVLLVRADHEARPMPHRPNGATGMLVRGGGVVVWFAGDTSLHEDMTLLPQLAGAPVDLALLPVGGWGPRLSPGHMGPAEAAEAATRAGALHVLPIHYGTLHPAGWPAARLAWTLEPGLRFADALERHTDAVALVPPVGGAVSVAPRGDGPR
jgi:L-ascorbate metabolism protein UlaG (beta-lactamase superfamily)